MEEVFKYVEGYEGLYQVSNLGRVKSLGNGNSNNSKERILRPKKDKGYLRVGLHKEGKQNFYNVHRLVAQAFIENPNNLPFINHKDENKVNNCVENLEYCDAKYNNTFGTRIGRMRAALTNRKDLSKQVKCLETGLVYPSTHQAQKETGIHKDSISRCCNGKYKTAGGYHWAFVKDED